MTSLTSLSVGSAVYYPAIEDHKKFHRFLDWEIFSHGLRAHAEKDLEGQEDPLKVQGQEFRRSRRPQPEWPAISIIAQKLFILISGQALELETLKKYWKEDPKERLADVTMER